MANHTPGPWETLGGPGFATEIGAMLNTPDAVIVADTRLMPYDPTPRQLADARLIAAAPDLLAALTAQRCFWCVQWIEVTEGERRPCNMCAPALAAIAKARGEASRAS